VSFAFAPVRFADATVAMVAVSQEAPPLSVTLSLFGPTIAVEALVVLLFGASAAALLVFRPARRRLAALQSAVQAIGSGRSDVRAPEGGGDEVAQLAVSFNEMAARLEARARALADADRTRRQLLADISHELATPLAAIRGYVETLGMSELSLDEPTRHRYLGIVTEEAERLEHMIGDLLDLAKLEGTARSFVAAPVLVSQLLDRVSDRHAPALLEREITLETSLADPGLTVSGEATRLEQALQNLAANALRHTPVGGRIFLRAAPDGEDVVIVVEDTGPGIPEEHLVRVFDRFYKVDVSRTGTALPSGTGLGLSIVQAIVTQHGGAVAVSNVPGAGARFEIRLPAHPQPAPYL
jgi:signal transduction histidine kinase